MKFKLIYNIISHQYESPKFCKKKSRKFVEYIQFNLKKKKQIKLRNNLIRCFYKLVKTSG